MNELISFVVAKLLLLRIVETLVGVQSTLSLACMGVGGLLLVEMLHILLVPLLLLREWLLLLLGVESVIVGRSGWVVLLLWWVVWRWLVWLYE